MRLQTPFRTSALSLLQVVRAMRVTLRRALGKRVRPALSQSFRGPPSLRVDASGRPTCTACGACVGACPTSAIRIWQTHGTAQLHLDWRRCTCCGICIRMCPVQGLEAQSSCEPPFVTCADQGGLQ